MVLEVRQITGFPLILKTEHNLSLLMVLIQSVKKLIVVSPKGQYQGHCYFLYIYIYIYINDLHYSIKFCKLYHFPDDTNLINFNSSIKIIYKQVNKDLKTLHDWLNANKICLNVSKTEFVLFRSTKKQMDFGFKLKLNGKRLYPTNLVKYLGVKIDEHLT